MNERRNKGVSHGSGVARNVIEYDLEGHVVVMSLAWRILDEGVHFFISTTERYRFPMNQQDFMTFRRSQIVD